MIADVFGLKSRLDLRELAMRYTRLRRVSARELAGPCPRCGGEDRFHVQAGWWFCRQCHPKRGDAIELVRFLNLAHSFRDAVTVLRGGTVALTVALEAANAQTGIETL